LAGDAQGDNDARTRLGIPFAMLKGQLDPNSMLLWRSASPIGFFTACPELADLDASE